MICGSAEPGRDGVGDYTRRLAAGLIRRGVDARLIATHDADAKEVRQEEQDDSGTVVTVLRIPAAHAERDRFEEIKRRIDAQAPAWISVQFVPYSYSDVGIPRRFAATLTKLADRARFEIMFHELWLRHRRRGDWKGRLTGALQRRTILGLCKTLRPAVVHTHIPINRDELIGRGVAAKPLPLFANIGRWASPDFPVTEKPAGAYRACFFSRMETPPPVLRVLAEVADWCRETGREFEVALLGGGQAKVSAAAEEIRSVVPEAVVLPVGYLPAEGVSAWLSTCDLALSPIPRHSQGKSGTVAAFLEHRLPVISPVIRQPREPFFSEALNAMVMDRFDRTAVARAEAVFRRQPDIAGSLEEILDTFIADLGLIGENSGGIADVSLKSQQ